MVVSNREIVNIKYSFYNSAMSHSIKVNTIFEDININVLRGRFISLSSNSSRELSAHSDLFFSSYVDNATPKKKISSI